jgi:aspartate aminotransferase
MNISQRLIQVPASPIRKLVPYAQKAKADGVKVYHLNIGDPDILTPPEMLSVLTNWQTNPVSYEQSQGNSDLLKAFTGYYHGLGYEFINGSNIQVTSGGSEAISMALFAVCEPGDEVLVFEPFYANYNSYAVMTGVKLVPVKTTIDNGFHLPDITQIEAKISAKTKAILICNPNNPTGVVYTRAEIEMLVGLAKKNHLFLLSDEVYREYVYDGKKQVSLFEYMQEMPDTAVVLDSVSKRYSLCGVRIGMLVSLNPELMSGVLRIAQGRLSCGLIDQKVTAKLADISPDYISGVQKEYDKRRQVLYNALKQIPGLTVPLPEGAFYIICGLPVSDSEAFCTWLLTDFRNPSASSGQAETVMIAPAAGFYATPGLGKNEVRIAYVLNVRDLTRSVEILKIALEQYGHR